MPRSEPPTGDAGQRPISVAIGVALAWAEAAGVLAFTVYFGVDVFPVGHPVLPRLAMALGVIVFLLAVVAALCAAARALGRLRHWPRSLLMVFQVIALALGVPFARDGFVIGWLICAAAAVLVVALLVPSTTAAIEG